jgi:hypothetical protein
MIADYATDIPESVAYAAHHGTSFVPERRAAQERNGYAETLQADRESLLKLADTDEKRAMLEGEFARYREGYRRRTLAYLHSRSRLVSVMIAGPSRFPVDRMSKRGDVVHKRLGELIEFRKRALEAIRRKLCPEPRPIMAGDSDAVERLQAEIDKAERLQCAMKQANEIIRRAPRYKPTPEKLADLMALGLKKHRAYELFQPDFANRMGFPDYALRNNGANIRRMKARLEQIRQAQATPETSTEGENARIEDCPAENRVRLFFPGKPDATIRDRLKSSGFRWAPSLGCWQAYRNWRSLQIAKEVAGVAEESQSCQD